MTDEEESPAEDALGDELDSVLGEAKLAKVALQLTVGFDLTQRLEAAYARES